MNSLIQLYDQHPTLFPLVCYFVFSAIVTSQPKPPITNYWGTWVYDALHLLAGSMQKIMEKRIQAYEVTQEHGPDGGVVDKTVVKTTTTGPAADPKP